MSLVFLKSEDKQGSKEINSHNPNTPSRFSNYLTQPIRLPPNSQVGYVSSQYTLGQSIDLDLEKSFLNITEIGTEVFSIPTQMVNNKEGLETKPIYEVISNQSLSSNEFGYDGDYTGLTYKKVNVENRPQEQPDTGIIQVYKESNDKSELKIIPRLAIDQYNLYFNSFGSNPQFLQSGWDTGVGAAVPAGLNFTNKVDFKFQSDIETIEIASEIGIPQRTTSCFGYKVGLETNLTNATPRIQRQGANFYNTGFLSQGIGTNPNYDWTQPAGTLDLPDYDDNNYACFFSTGAIKKQIGEFTPSTDEQQSNTGGHISPGGFNITSGGYGIQGFSNTDNALAVQHYSAGVTDRVGYCGIAPFYAGIQPISLVQQIGYDTAKNSAGLPESTSRQFQIQLQYYNFLHSLNNSQFDNEPIGNLAYYLFGMVGRDVEVNGNQNFQISCEILNPSNTTADESFTNSNYDPIGRTLDVYKLSKGINTATDDGTEYTFDAGANYSINVFDYSLPRVGAGLFFRYRWVNKYQMNIEFTLSVDGYAGTYDSATDEPYEPPGFIAPAPSVPSTPVQNIALDATTTGGSTNITSQTTFTDSGGGGNYDPNESYDHIFVAPVGLNASFTINDIEFEHSSFSMYDRLGVQSSPDGVTWTNVSFAGFRSSVTTAAPWSTSFGSPSTPGWIFPRDIGTLSSLGGNPSQTFDVGERYVKFTFESDGSQQERGWNLSMNAVDPGTTPNANDPRDKWVILSTMNYNQGGISQSYFIPSYMGDIGMIYYPVAGITGDEASLRSLQKGWLDVRQTNRFFRNNNNGGGQQYAPYSNDNPAYIEEGLGLLRLDTTNPTSYEDPDLTSTNFINNDYLGKVSVFSNETGREGTFDLNTIYYLGVPLQSQEDLYLDMDGLAVFDLRNPDTEVGYVLGYNDNSESVSIKTLTQDVLSYILEGQNSVQPSSRSATNHFQLTNLPIKSQNGVVSSVSKTIYVANTLCVTKTQDEGSYRFFCDRTTFPIWIDLNNLETIELNKIDVLITNDNNIEQQNLEGTTELVIMFRQKETGILPNSIPTNSMSMTRTY